MAVQLDQNGKDDLKTQFSTREGTYRLMTLSEYSRPNRVGYQTNQNNPQVRVSLITLPAGPSLPSVVGAIGATHQNTSATTPYVVPSTVNSSTSNNNNNNNATTNTTTPSSSSNSGTVVETPPSVSSIGLGGGGGVGASVGGPGTSQVDGGILSALQSQGSANGGGGDRICFNFGKELYVYAYRGCKKVSILFDMLSKVNYYYFYYSCVNICMSTFSPGFYSSEQKFSIVKLNIYSMIIIF